MDNRIHSEIYLAEDGQTLIVRRRFDIPTNILWYVPTVSKYIRIRAGEKWTESMLLTLPIKHVFLFDSRELPQETIIAKRLKIEIGYYEGDMPEMIFNSFEPEKSNNDSAENRISMGPFFGGAVMFNSTCEQLIQQKR